MFLTLFCLPMSVCVWICLRRMFPSIDITVTGLNPNSKYMMIMDVVPVSNWRYKYVEQEWVVSRPSTGAPLTDYFVHPKSPSLGVDWMEEDISFGGMKLTNLEEKSEGMVSGRGDEVEVGCSEPDSSFPVDFMLFQEDYPTCSLITHIPLTVIDALHNMLLQ